MIHLRPWHSAPHTPTAVSVGWRTLPLFLKFFSALLVSRVLFFLFSMPCIELGCVIQSTRKKLSLVLLFRFETQICSQGSHKLCECRSDHSGTVTSIYPCALKVLDCMSVITNCSTEFKMSFKRSEVHLLEISPSFA